MKREFVLSPTEEEYRRTLHGLFFNDREMASLCGVSQASISRWRVRRGLKSIPMGFTRPWEQKQRLQLYWRGYTDKKIADCLGWAEGTIRKWREKSKLPLKRDRAKSLCWECNRAFADKCPWIDNGEKVWGKAKYPNKLSGPVVITCPNFEFEKEEDDAMWMELEKARMDYKIALLEFDAAAPEYMDAAILKYSAAKERLNAVIKEAKLRKIAELRGGGAA